ncbi:MAG: SUMF1/EgtB/PvdO family nonheme iron enzyme [Planctomycetes bacterium]|nr:SUMF1/EgtB/PvdO family nonheme iron enzyme [Planctomycetota bacterium]
MMKADPGSSDFFVAGGTLPPDSPSYVERPADDELFNLALAGNFCYVLTPRQMGKSSLKNRIARRLQEQGSYTASLDLTRMGISQIEQWYFGLLSELKRELGLSVKLNDWWQEHASLGVVHRFTDFLRDVVLAEIKGQVVIFIDEIDTTRKLDFKDDFFAAIRAMYNDRAENPALKRLTFVLLGVASPPDLIEDKTRTPFNIGQSIALHEFSQADAAVLQAELEAVYPGQGEAIFSRIYYWTNGHPYLTQKLCLAVTNSGAGSWTKKRVDGLVERLFLSEEARKEHNLQFVRHMVLDHPQRRELLILYKKLHAGKPVSDDERSPIQNRLKLSGLVKAENGYLQIRNEIYRRVFSLAWARKNTAINWALISAGVAIFVAVLAVGSIVYNNWVQNQVNGAIAHFYETNDPKDRLVDLAKIFRLQSIFEPRDHDYQARELFYTMSGQEQLALLNVYDVENADLIVVIKGLYITLADVDNTGSTDLLLAAMVGTLNSLDEPEETAQLKDEIKSWLEGRKLAKQDQYENALAEYNKAIDLNSENVAILYERARILTKLSEYQQALNDLDQVMAIAGRSTIPTPTASPVASVVPTDIPVPSPTSTTTTIDAPLISPLSTSPLPTPTEMPIPTATPPASFISGFATTAQMISAVRNLINSNPALTNELVNAPSLYSNLEDFGLMSIFIDSIVIEMIMIPEGNFISGTGDNVINQSLDTYYIDKYEVTNAQYSRCVQAEICRSPVNSIFDLEEYQQHPVTDITLADGEEYCNWIGGYLPSELQWEKAARGVEGFEYPWGNDPVQEGQANICDTQCPESLRVEAINDGFPQTAPVGSFPLGATPFGVEDMVGNVWEWTSDGVVRGGSWQNDRRLNKATSRVPIDPQTRDANSGFRCASSTQLPSSDKQTSIRFSQPAPLFGLPSYLVWENQGQAIIDVVLSEPAPRNIYVDYTTKSDTATPGRDYEHTSGVLVFEPGEDRKTFEITIIEDGISEEDESVIVSLSNAVGASIDTPQAILVIRDNN